ncbi:uncharacterized protein BDV14DRAFT_211806 [Aspergillus stella-maris]|uniref:uncharacterized protein n=1 Tax=Aspergillus stella-maris TaxID=1810926 RepID=UPI003CCDD389
MFANVSSNRELTAEVRCSSCLLLNDHKVPYVIWFEDALKYHEVPTAVFDLYLLVLNIDLAADYLFRAGWTIEAQRPYRVGMADVTDTPIVSLMSFDGPTRIFLLVALDWKFSLTTDSVIELVPCLIECPTTTYALIETWLDGPSDDARLLTHLAEQSSAAQLKYEHRQFHYDILSGMEPGTLPFRKHQLEVREAILRGECELQECSVHCDHDLLVDVWTNVRKGLPEPPLDGTTE